VEKKNISATKKNRFPITKRPKGEQKKKIRCDVEKRGASHQSLDGGKDRQSSVFKGARKREEISNAHIWEKGEGSHGRKILTKKTANCHKEVTTEREEKKSAGGEL